MKSKRASQKQSQINPGSFRDPSGFVYFKGNELYRQIHKEYLNSYNKLMDSGLYQELVDAKLLVPHQEVDLKYKATSSAKKVIKPEKIPFISYPYEWSFSQLQDAALLTLAIQQKALTSGMSLKDASGYNVQFLRGKPVFIDTLSFETYESGKPWVAYRQFCQHFVAPLALASYVDIDLLQILKVHPDGIPLQLASTLLPKKSWLNFGITTHIHMHAKSQQRYQHSSNKESDKKQNSFNQKQMMGLITSLESTVKSLNWEVSGNKSEWGDYYQDTNYSQKAFEHKHKLVASFIKKSNPNLVWDIGANTGEFSIHATEQQSLCIAMDTDPVAVEKNYLNLKERHDEYMLPLCVDITNPSAGIGWRNMERHSLIDRGPADLILALALIHHLVIGSNVPMKLVASLFASICSNLVIEYVPKKDSQVKKLLRFREDVFPNYTQAHFEKTFGQFFTLREKVKINDSLRSLYWYECR